MEPAQVFWIVLATAGVVLLAVLVGVLAVVLLDLRRTSRALRETVEHAGPPAVGTLLNVHQISQAAAEAADSVREAGKSLRQVKRPVRGLGGMLPLAAGIAGAYSAWRARSADRRRSDQHHDAAASRKRRRR
jgi:hypothetical protein